MKRRKIHVKKETDTVNFDHQKMKNIQIYWKLLIYDIDLVLCIIVRWNSFQLLMTVLV